MPLKTRCGEMRQGMENNLLKKEGGFRLRRQSSPSPGQTFARCSARIPGMGTAQETKRASRHWNPWLILKVGHASPKHPVLVSDSLRGQGFRLPTLIESAAQADVRLLAKRGYSKTLPKVTSWYAVNERRLFSREMLVR